MLSCSPRAGKGFSLMAHPLISLLDYLSIPQMKLINPFDVCPPPPTSQQRNRLRAAVFVSENCGVAHSQIRSARTQNFVVHQQRNVSEMINGIGACIEYR